MGEYEELFSHYFNKIEKDFGLTEKQIGFIALIVRTEEKGGTDLASNLCDKHIIAALEDILKTMREKLANG